MLAAPKANRQTDLGPLAGDGDPRADDLETTNRTSDESDRTARGDASVARSVGIGAKSGERGTLMAVTFGL